MIIARGLIAIPYPNNKECRSRIIKNDGTFYLDGRMF